MKYTIIGNTEYKYFMGKTGWTFDSYYDALKKCNYLRERDNETYFVLAEKTKFVMNKSITKDQ